jgi:hypothetical protein
MSSRASWIRIGGVAAVLCLMLMQSRAETEPLSMRPGAAPSLANRYIGAERCVTCHADPDTGDQCGKWKQLGHSRAYEVLASPRALEVAATLDIADPQTSDACLRCHSTGFGLPKAVFQPAFDHTAGVQCETCHGPGERHMMARLMGATPDGSYPEIPANELLQPTPALCLGCHNTESPTYEPFCPHERMAVIRHLNPKKPRTEAERSALDACDCKVECVCKAESEDGSCRAASTGGDDESEPAESDEGG